MPHHGGPNHGLGRGEAALSGRGKASSVRRVEQAFRLKVHPAPGEVDVTSSSGRWRNALALAATLTPLDPERIG
jgi:hypothetical protein